ncbi:MAG: lipoate--protein ligase family protein [Ignavibacteriaceae bacterium]
MNWRFINTGFNSGKFNMAFDVSLADNHKPGEAVLRLYRWKPYCISLGANQSFDTINIKKAADDKIDVVKRPTGGRAVLHSEELTYSVVMPIEHDSSSKMIFFEINKAISEGLALYNNMLSSVDLEKSQPDFKKYYKEEYSAACFAAPAKNELKFNGKKLAGSAQRKLGNVLLQHGSILCGDFHKNIVDYLVVNSENFDKVKSLLDYTADLFSITGREVNYDFLAQCVARGFESYFNSNLIEIKDDELFEHVDINSIK